MSHHPLRTGTPRSDSRPASIVLGSATVGVVGRRGVTHIHVVLQDLRGRLSQVSEAQLELEELGEGIHVRDLAAHLIQDPPHGGELGQWDPAKGG